MSNRSKITSGWSLFTKKAWPTEPRAQQLFHQLQRINHWHRYTLANMFSDFTDAARTCSGPFEAHVGYQLRCDDDVQKYGKAWVAQLQTMTTGRFQWPPKESRLSCRQARKVLKASFPHDRLGRVCRKPFPGQRTVNGFCAGTMPLLRVHISTLPNGGNRLEVGNQVYWVHENHREPINPIRNGDFYLGSSNRVTDRQFDQSSRRVGDRNRLAHGQSLDNRAGVEPAALHGLRH